MKTSKSILTSDTTTKQSSPLHASADPLNDPGGNSYSDACVAARFMNFQLQAYKPIWLVDAREK